MHWLLRAKVSGPVLEGVEDLWLNRRVLPPEVFYALSDELKARSISIKGDLWRDLIAEVGESIFEALSQGVPQNEWAKDWWPRIAARYGAQDAAIAARMETIFRTNALAAYAGGRYARMFDGPALEASPYVRYRATRDSRTRPEHWALNGLVWRKTDLAARCYYPPWSFGCRCWLDELTEEDLRAGGWQVTDGGVIEMIKLPDGKFVARPPAGWDVDRVRSLVPGVLTSEGKPAVPPPRPALPRVPPPAPATPVAGPAGTPVSSHVKKLPSGARRAEVERVLQVIDSVHGDGTLGRMEIKAGKGDSGFYRHSGTIKFGTSARHWAVQVAHEVGHWIDYRGVHGWDGRSSTGLNVMHAVMAAIDRSAAVGRLRAKLPSGRTRDYLLSPTELWARAYSQFIAEESGDQALLDQVAMWCGGRANRDPDGLWDTLDFAPIRAEILEMMKGLGWRN